MTIKTDARLICTVGVIAVDGEQVVNWQWFGVM
jgi:hypothetical protein